MDVIPFSPRSDKERNDYEDLRTVDRTPARKLCTVFDGYSQLKVHTWGEPWKYETTSLPSVIVYLGSLLAKSN